MVRANPERNFPFGRLCLPFTQTVDQPVSIPPVNGKQPKNKTESLLLTQESSAKKKKILK